MKRILIVTESLGIDGPERVISVLAPKWREMGCDITIFLTNPQNHEQTYQISPQIRIEKMDSSGLKPLKLLKDAFIIRRYLSSNPDAVGVSLMLAPSFSLAIAGIGLKNKIVLSERNDPHKVPFKWIQRKMRDLSLWLADVVVFQTEDAKKYFCKKTRSKGTIILNPINPTLPEPYQGARKKEFVAVGRLAKQKNFPLLINAFKEFTNTFKNYKLTIYGEGPEREMLQALIDNLGLTDKVNMPGFATNVYEKIVDSTAYISSSDFEGMSNSMLEAMCMGIPVICTDCPIGGARQVINNRENGFLVPTGNVGAMSTAMFEIVGNPGTASQVAERAAELRDNLNVNSISRQWLELM